jgi:hypothetical protein
MKFRILSAVNFISQRIVRPFFILGLVSGLISTSVPVFGHVQPVHPHKAAPAEKRWVGTWGTARQLIEPNNMPPAPGLSNNTLRQVVCVSIGGKSLRLKLSNEFGKSPVTMKAIQIAVSKGNGTIDAGTVKGLTFNGKTEVTLEPGTELWSDAASFNLKPRTEVAITIAFGETSPTITGHPGSRTTSYLLAGNQTGAGADFTNAVKMDHWYYINGIDVDASKSAGAVAVLAIQLQMAAVRVPINKTGGRIFFP